MVLPYIQIVCFPNSVFSNIDSHKSSGENLCENVFMDSLQNSSPGSICLIVLKF